MAKEKQNHGKLAYKVIRGREDFKFGRNTHYSTFYISYGVKKVMDGMIRMMRMASVLNILTAIPKGFQPGAYTGSANVPAKLDERESIIPSRMINQQP